METVVVEIRPAEGGDDAKLFALNVYRSIIAYAALRKWEAELVEMRPAARAGYQEIVFTVRGRGAWDALSKEAGGHRVQRIPPTERHGRRQTSTVTVAVLPEPSGSTLVLLDRDLKWETMRASGPGGQGVNTTASAVRVTHTPTGVSATCQTRSQHQNKDAALSVLRARLQEQATSKQDQARNRARSQQIGSGMRGDKIRTIRYQDDTVTDHSSGRQTSVTRWERGYLDDLR